MCTCKRSLVLIYITIFFITCQHLLLSNSNYNLFTLKYKKDLLSILCESKSSKLSLIRIYRFEEIKCLENIIILNLSGNPIEV
jgi:hypothetical protein